MDDPVTAGAHSDRIFEAISKSKERSAWVLDRFARQQQLKNEPRHLLPACSFDLALEHCDAVVSLVDSHMTGSALSLLRPTWESYIRGLWLFHCATDSQIKEFAKERFDPSLEKMIKDLEKLERFRTSLALSETWKNKRTFHSLTHSGLLHLRMRKSSEGIGASYTESGILTALRFANLLSFLSLFAFAEVCGANEDVAYEILEKMKQYIDTE